MKNQYIYIFIILFISIINLNCSSGEVREIEKDDILEEELRAESEPFQRELREKETREDFKKKSSKLR